MKKIVLVALMALCSASFGDVKLQTGDNANLIYCGNCCDVACKNVCMKITNEQQRTECLADCGYDKKGFCIGTR